MLFFSARAALRAQKILVLGPGLIGPSVNLSLIKHLSTLTSCPVGGLVFITQHSARSACIKSLDVPAARSCAFFCIGAEVLGTVRVFLGCRETPEHTISKNNKKIEI